jgi:ATP-dependent helicase HepA
MSSLVVGNLVVHPEVPGLARVGEVRADQVRLDCFESVTTPVAKQVWARSEQCRHVRLALQTRVFWQDPDTGTWHTGRVVGGEPPVYFIRFPNSREDRILPESALRVRWDRPASDPLAVLISGGNESPFFRDARLPMLSSLVRQRAACGNIPALLSSAAELYPHQVQAALTILNDPVQRYLLADEVGLGKTIEAGYVIRQLLLDDRTARVAIVVPDVLRRQWRSELVDRFFIDDFPSATIKIAAHESPSTWSKYGEFDLLVVDEAQQLARTRDPDQSPYRELRAVAHAVPRLLLLSATPVMRHEWSNLALLHLLDPDLYRWEEIDRFRGRLHLRKRLANAVFSLTDDYEYLLPGVIEEIGVLTPPDPRMRQLSAAVLELLGENGDLRAESDRAALRLRVEALRAHISETYRLHRRVIRHRRSQVLRDDQDSTTLPFEVRGRRHPEVLLHGSDAHLAGQQAVLEWQTTVHDWLLDHDARGRAVQYGQLLAVLLSRAGGPLDDLIDALRWRVLGDARAAESAGLSPEERAVAGAPELLPGERGLLERLDTVRAGLPPEDLSATLAGPIQRCGRLVVFCGPGSLASWLAATLRAAPLGIAVHEHNVRVGAEPSETAVQDWLDHGGVLVADASADAGRNLQRADGVVHCRLPWSPNELEQRIGRVDRYGSQAAAFQYVLGDRGGVDHLAGAWLATLTTGFEVFERSISALQEVVDERLPAVWEVALAGGPAALVEESKTLRDALAEERREVERLDVLEASYQPAGGVGRDIFVALDDLEADWRSIRDVTVNYAGGSAGGLRLGLQERRDGSLKFTRTGRDPLVSSRLLLSMATIPEASRSGMFNRARTLRFPGIRVLRIGNPMIDLLGRVATIDDRGQASAHWRLDRRLNGETLAYFGFDYLIEAATQQALHLVNHAVGAGFALRRQADQSLAPFLLRVWIPAFQPQAVSDPELLVWLNQPYAHDVGDKNLSGDRLADLHDLFGDEQHLARAGRLAEEAAREQLIQTSELRSRARAAAEHARQRIAISAAQAEARQAAGRLLSDTESYLTDVAVAEALAAGLEQPNIRLAAVTCLIRSATAWGDHAG